MAGTLSVPGALTSSNVTNGVTQAYTTLGVGNLLCVGMRINTVSITPVSMSGGNATGWQRLQVGTAYAGMAIFAGTVTATGASTLTVTCSAAPTANLVEWAVREFASQYGAKTSWVLNASNIVNNSVASTSVTYPTLAPLATPALYFGYAFCGGVPSATSSGGTTFELTSSSNLDCYNTTVAASIGPVGTAASNTSQAAGMLWSAQSALPLPVTNINQVAVTRAAAY